ncbi:hypothetical protein HCN44_006916 [Aphidius gifuensis]|uniref:Uncharacterized protein n=1 Tax=Aphidius gifuensis TaxID=684658 RepID=A0A835CU71_APHGI|nr:glutathione hydrolase-like [Aphidius gifuensis]KAF7995809.1 hypothetical protein HCN44_006916 [Aphidius gifuensis]
MENDDCYKLCDSKKEISEDYETSEASEDCPLTPNKKCRYKKCIWKYRVAGCILTFITIIIVIFLIYLLSKALFKKSHNINDDDDGPHGAVAADNEICSKIGVEKIQQGGNAIDAAVASMICMCVVAPEKSGFGGGGIAMVYRRNGDNPLVIDFATNTITGFFETAKIRIPSVLRGLEYLHSMKGKLPWSSVVKPGANLAKNNFHFTENVNEKHGKLNKRLINNHDLNMKSLGETLDSISQHGTNILYNGTLSKKLLHDKKCPHLLNQLASYMPKKISSKKINFYDYSIFSPEHSTIFQSTLMDTSKLSKNKVDTIAKITVNLIDNLAYKNGNSCIEKEIYTSVVAADSDGNFVSIITGMSVAPGLEHMSGVGFHLDTIKTHNNLKLLTPIIFTKEKTTTGVLGVDDPILATEILTNMIIEKLNLSSSIEHQRYYRTSKGIKLEPQTTNQQLNYPKNIKTLIEIYTSIDKNIYKSVNGIVQHHQSLTSHSDSRGGGIAYRFK